MLTLCAVLVPLILVGLYVLQKHQWAQDQLARAEPRYARLLGLEARRDELLQTEVQARSMLARYTYPTSQDVSQAGNDAQQRIRQLFTQAGLEILSSQVLTPKTEKQFDRIPLSVRSEGDLVALQSALVVLESQTPSIFIDELTVQLVPPARPDRPLRLQGQFNLSVLRVRP